MDITVLLHNVRSAHNVGSIFRSADAAGVARIYLSGYTPTPTDRFGRAQKKMAKTALGAEASVPWEYARSPHAFLRDARKHGRKIIGVEQDARAKDYRRFAPRGRMLLLFGNEVRGLSKELRSACDTLIEIPMHGKKESLNVSVAAGIIFFSLR